MFGLDVRPDADTDPEGETTAAHEVDRRRLVGDVDRVAGLWEGDDVPRVTPSVAVATAESVESGSGRGLASTLSPTQTPSKPSASARRARSITPDRTLAACSSELSEDRTTPRVDST